MEKYLFIIQILTTFMMTGIIWFVQVVHYPFFAFTNKEEFPQIGSMHSTHTGYVVAPIMVLELATSLYLVAYYPGTQFQIPFGIGAGLILLIWGSTFFIQVPIIKRLLGGFDEGEHKRLVNTNWIRTILWSARSLILFYILLCSTNDFL